MCSSCSLGDTEEAVNLVLYGSAGNLTVGNWL